jgi:uncharacterized membrane protein YfcA
MPYPAAEFAFIALVMTLGSILQGAIGFASGLLGVPILVLGGLSLPEAATINLVSTSVQNIAGSVQLWSHIKPRELVFPVLLRWLAIPLGTYAAWLTDKHLTPDQSKQLIGVGLLTVIVLLKVCRVRPRDYLNLFWQTLAFSTSGFLLGFASIGGAPLVLYVNALTWDAARSRAFLFYISAMGIPVAVIAFALNYGQSILPAVVTSLLLMPLIFAGLWLGLNLGNRIAKPLFERISYALLVLTAVVSIVWPLISAR